MISVIVGNWKMNGSLYDLLFFCDELKKYITTKQLAKTEVILCPPFTMLSAISDIEINIAFGAQDCHREPKGAYTGGVSAGMIADLGCSHVIVGHSERRLYCHETDSDVHRKASLAIEAGLHPIICVGESAHDRENGLSRDVILKQCEQSFPHSHQYTIAYEPVWAIGKKISLNTEIISKTIGEIAANYPGRRIIYGGSVTQDNANQLAEVSGISGLLVGGASLDAEHFCNIIKTFSAKL